MKRKVLVLVHCTLFLAGTLCIFSGAVPASAYDVDVSGPLAVEDCVKIALEKNHNIAMAHQGVDVSEGAALSAWAGVLPNVSAGAYWDRLTQGPTQQLTLNERTGEIIVAQTQSQSYVAYSMGVSASQSLFDWSSIQNVSRARADLAAARHASEAAEQTVTYEVKQQFYTLVRAQKLMEVNEKSLERSRKQLERAESLLELGSVARSDVLKAKVDVAQGELNLIAAKNSFEMERARLAKVMGLSVDVPLEIKADLGFEETDIKQDEALQEAMRRRPDLQEAKEKTRAARAQLQAARGGRYPSLGGFFSYRWRDDKFPNSTSDFDSRYTWDVGLGVSFPIFDGMRTRGSVGEANAGLLTTQEQLADLELTVRLEIKEAFIALEEATQSIRVSEEQLAAAEESYKLAQEQYEVGLGTILELTGARVELTTAESQWVNAMTSLKIAGALLDRARGKSVVH